MKYKTINLTYPLTEFQTAFGVELLPVPNTEAIVNSWLKDNPTVHQIISIKEYSQGLCIEFLEGEKG